MLNSRLSAPVAAFLASLLLYGGALVSQYGFGLHPCEMCYWQRWPHDLAIVLALFGIGFRKEKLDRYFEKKKKRNWKTIRYEPSKQGTRSEKTWRRSASACTDVSSKVPKRA